MKRILFLFLVFFITINTSFSAYIENMPITLIQPNGAKIHCFLSGDEFFNYAHDAEGYPIILNPKTAYYVYAENIGNKMVPSMYIVGSVNPKAVGLTNKVVFPKEKILEERKRLAVNRKTSYSNNTGTINNIVVFIRFSDETEFVKPFSEYYSDFNDLSPDSNSMYQYFKQVSYNQLHINSTFYPQPSGNTIVSYQDSHPRSYYMPYDEFTNTNGYEEWQRDEREHTLLANAVNAIENQISPLIDIDFNDDGYVDNICFIIKGEPTAWATLLWPHRWALYYETVLINGLQVWDFNFQIESFFDLPTRGVGVLNHEMFHTLGAPDLYHYDWDYRNFRSMGYWDLMDRSTNPSESMCAWMKFNYGQWIGEIPELLQEGIYTINSIDKPNNNCYKITVPNTENEFFVFEYRSKRGVFESSIPGSGLLVTRINPNSNGNADYPFTPDEVYAFRPDGIDTVTGKLDSAFFSIASNRIRFNNNTNPSCQLSDGTFGDFYITILSETDSTITFYYGFEETSDIKTNLSAIESRDFVCSPNPASNLVYIKTSNSNSIFKYIRAYNAVGETVFYQQTVFNECILDFSNKPKGVYFMELYINNKQYTEKLIIY